MLRLIGILTGAALAIGFLIVALGVPELSEPETVVEPEPVVAVARQPDPVPEPAPDPEPIDEPARPPEPEPVPIAEVTSGPDYDALVDQIFEPQPGPADDENWYSFWSPFRSEIAANGFVSKLQESTGIDYRVVKVDTGVYEVAFAYSDDADVQEKLSRISAATGLDMSDS